MGNKIMINKEDLELCLELGLKREQMAERFKCSVGTLDKRMKEYGLKYLKATYFNRGSGNPVNNPNVKRKIANTISTLWQEGYYANRQNGMTNKTGFDHPNYTGHTYEYRDYLAQYQDLNVCSECGKTIEESKIDIHHIDEDHNNWLVTNLVPLCVKCHRHKHGKHIKQPRVTIGIKGHFDSSHNLLNYNGKCARLHGHRYFYEVKVRNRINEHTGMVMDFKELKAKTKQGLEELLDHEYLNDILPFNTTAENMTVWLFEYLSKRELVKGLVEVSLWETPDCVCTFTYKDMLQIYKDNKLDTFLKEEV